MDLPGFLAFSLSSRFVLRWVGGGLAIFIPVLNFLPLGYLAKASQLFGLGDIGLPTWGNKGEIWKTGGRLFYVIILYEALPSFLFSCGFFLASFGNAVTSLLGGFLKILAALAFVGCSFFIPFAFCAFAERNAVKAAFEFERIAAAVSKVLVRYALGIVVSGACMYGAYRVHRIPYLVGFVLSSLITYYVLLVATYYFTQLFRKTALARRA